MRCSVNSLNLGKYSWTGGKYLTMFPFAVQLNIWDTGEAVYVYVDWGDGSDEELWEPQYLPKHVYNVQEPNGKYEFTIMLRATTWDYKLIDTKSFTLPIIASGLFGISNSSLSLTVTASPSSNIMFVGGTATFSAKLSTDYSASTGFWSDVDRHSWSRWDMLINGSWYSVEEAVSAGLITLVSQTFTNTEAILTVACLSAGSYAAEIIATGNYVSYGASSMGYYDSHYEISTGWTRSETFTVYEHGSANVGVASYTSKNNAPPYTVTVYDASPTSNRPPITARMWDFGDPESGAANNSTDYQPTHMYSGYGPYTITLTIWNAAGETAVARYIYSPNKTQRIITPMSVTQDKAEAPSIVSCSVGMAGYPAPSVTWSYALQGDTYSGSEEGDFVELSLIKPGTYTITMTAVQSGASNIVQTKTVTVTAPTEYADTPVTMNDFDIWVYDENDEPVDILQPAKNIMFADRYAHEKAVSFSIPSDYQYRDRLKVDCEFDAGYLGVARRFVVMSYSENEKGTEIDIDAVDFASYLFRYRAALIATKSSTGKGRDVQTCTAEAIMRYFAISNLSGALRSVGKFRLIGSNEDRGGECTYSARFDTISSIIDEICSDSGLGWETSLQSASPIAVGWKVIEGVDRTVGNAQGNAEVIFSARPDGMRNATIGRYAECSCPNVAIGAGEGSGYTRDYDEHGDTSATGVLRREVFVDAGESANADEVRLRCFAKLNDLKDQSISVYPNEDCPWEFGVDYKVGDDVTIETRSGEILNMQIVSAEYSLYQEGGKSLMLTCGTERRSNRTILRELALGNTYAKK